MPADHASWDTAHTLARLGGDEGLFHEIIEIFMQQAPKQMASMREALAQGDKDATERIAHTLKRELGYLGISGASHNACELEDAEEKVIWSEQSACISFSKEMSKTSLIQCVMSWRGMPTGHPWSDHQERIDSRG
jgi:HPt (histidine-containing phosphotransfer) domain-containing protein